MLDIIDNHLIMSSTFFPIFDFRAEILSASLSHNFQKNFWNFFFPSYFCSIHTKINVVKCGKRYLYLNELNTDIYIFKILCSTNLVGFFFSPIFRIFPLIFRLMFIEKFPKSRFKESPTIFTILLTLYTSLYHKRWYLLRRCPFHGMIFTLFFLFSGTLVYVTYLIINSK